MIKRLANFLTRDLWRIRMKNLSRSRSFLIHPLRLVMLAWRGFDQDKCQLRASALTFYSLLSMVPVVAMAFGIAKGFGFENLLEKVLLERFQGQEQVVTQIIGFANTVLQNTRGGLIAGIGVVVLFWTVIQVLGSIETSFNDIWGIKQSRPLMRKFTDYLSIMLICPILLIVSSSATIFIASEVKTVLQRLSFLGTLAPAIIFSIQILPFVVIWAVFTFIYIFMPNTKVDFKAAFLGGIVAGTVYQVTQWAYITFQIGVSSYGAIYGSFAALPLFLVWLQVSWLIVLMGAEVTFAYQNVGTYEFEPDCLEISAAYKRLLTLRIVNLSAKRFCKAEAPLTEAKFSGELDIPIRLIRQILFELVSVGIFYEVVVPGDKEKAFAPSRCVEHLTIKDVSDMLDHKGTTNIPVLESKELKKIREHLEVFSKTVKNSPANILLKDI
jgi:membrane protein